MNRYGSMLLALLVALPAQAFDWKARLEAEGRWFFEDPERPRLGSAAGTLEIFQGWDDDRQRLVGEFFLRQDEDPRRRGGDVRELYWQLTEEDAVLHVGARRVFWGVTESRHLVDVINQSDFAENISGEIKLGQPMLDLALVRDIGTFEFYVLPYARERTFPGPQGHPRLPVPVAEDEAQYEVRDGQRLLNVAMRFTRSFGPLDIGLAVFEGTAREPRLQPCLKRGASGTYVQGSADGPTCDIFAGLNLPQGNDLTPFLQALGLAPSDEEVRAEVEAEIARNLVLVPFYDRLTQGSVDAQVVFGSLALKLEALARTQRGIQTHAAVSGFEYTFGDVAGSGVDVGLVGEYLWDERSDFLSALADDEVFVGSRIGLNDVAGTQALLGVIASREDFGNRLYGVEASRRIGDDWKISLETRIFEDLPDDPAVKFLEDQDFATVLLERFF